MYRRQLSSAEEVQAHAGELRAALSALGDFGFGPNPAPFLLPKLRRLRRRSPVIPE
jgi:hypothetical protein